MNIYSHAEVDQKYPNPSNPSLWTVVIPAAGRGSRLGYSKPKILYEVAGKTILDRLLDLLDPFCSQFIFILSEKGSPDVTPYLEKRVHGKYTIAIQKEPNGMADALCQALVYITTPYTFIIWGDQAAISKDTVRATMALQEFTQDAMLTMPIVQREEPYVHYIQDEAGRFTGVLEKREGAIMPPVGQSDCGVFACNTQRLKEIFQFEITNGIRYSKGTHEWNFLPMLPLFEVGGNSVNGLTITSMEETIGVNDSNDVARLEQYLKQ
jgi:bifunctional UDP-N-acetylglucosamine pyrophosphorylase / glucosamine-1-phosphate N-acetyltransferase